MYIFTKGRLSMASTKLEKMILSGRMLGGTRILSETVLELVRIIQTNGKIMMMDPKIRAA
jgi:hypothetical protein